MLALEKCSSQFWGEIFGDRIALALDEQAQVETSASVEQEPAYVNAKEVAAATGLLEGRVQEAKAGNRANTGVPGKKIPTDKGWDFGKWWAGVT